MSGSFSEPDELFDVCDSLGRPLGLRKRRADVHRDGDWHRALHCWVVGQYEDGTPYVDLSASVGGEGYVTGKTGCDRGRSPGCRGVSRRCFAESQEEIGLELSMDDLLPLGVRQAASDVEPGVRDYEVQYVFLHRTNLPLTAFTPNPAEVTALVRIPVADAMDLFTGKRPAISAKALCNQRCHPNEAWLAEQRIRADDFIAQADRYFYRVCVQIDLLYRNYPHISI